MTSQGRCGWRWSSTRRHTRTISSDSAEVDRARRACQNDPMERIDPDFAADERTTLAQFLDYQRDTLLLKTEGLDAAQLSTRIPTSELTLAGLL
ncbi:MAG TPA: DUF664 domain-containing protein, partial [Terrimesophilobacter sp.]|uniref:mycothiol transferase n=1 Tax=Terrimesophilobacter sp. TaxID=2906435 RepID=UPI002F920C02